MNTTPAACEVALGASHDPRKVVSSTVLTDDVVNTGPVMFMLIEDGSRSGDVGDRSGRNRASEVVLIPLWTGAGLPLHTTEVAEFVVTEACHMEAAVCELDHVVALGALLPLAALGNVHEELDVRIARA